MTIHAYQWLFIATVILLANWPFISSHFLGVFSIQHKTNWHRLLEWVLAYGLAGLLARLLEQRLMGNIHPQEWEFYVVTLSLFAVFALPGFVWRYIR